MFGKNVFQRRSEIINRTFFLFLASQAISSLGDSFQLVAATTLMVGLTGTGISAAFTLVCTPIASLLLSTFAGNIGDNFREKNLLILFDILRAVVVILFLLDNNILYLYFCTLLLASLDIFYSPPRKKILSAILRDNQIMAGNSLLTGVSGVAYLLGPLLAGVLVDVCGVEAAFIINSISFIVSAILMMFTRTNKTLMKQNYNKQQGCSRRHDGIKEGLGYFQGNIAIRDTVIMITVLCIGVSSVNTAFYPYAFDTLRTTARGWGLMMSIYYGTNLLAMFIPILLDKKIKKYQLIFLYLLFLVISGVWFLYGIVENLLAVLLLVCVEGTAEAVCGIVLSTKLQLLTQKAYIARIMGINDLINNAGKLFSIGITYLIFRLFSYRLVFAIDSFFLLAFIIHRASRIRFIKVKRLNADCLNR